MKSFEFVTGKKTDKWLVKTVSVLILSISLGLFASLLYGITQPVVWLALSSACFLMLIDSVYVARRVISKIYLLDAAAEMMIIAGWITCLLA